MKKHIINIQGPPASGKSRTATLLQSKKDILGEEFEIVSTGKIAREIAEKNGWNPKDFNNFPAHARKNSIPYDSVIDEELRKFGESDKKLIIDCRMGYHFIPNSFNILLVLDPQIAAERVLKDVSRPDSPKYNPKKTLKQIQTELEEREESDRRRYIDSYNTDCCSYIHYNMISNTAQLDPDWIAHFTACRFRDWLKQK